VLPWTGNAADGAGGRHGDAEGPGHDYEYQVLVRLAEVLPADVRVRIVADCRFGGQKLYRVLTEELKFDFVIRFRGNIMVTAADGEARVAAEWVGAVVCVQAKDMKEPWCLATSMTNETARALIDLYGKGLGIEGAFRDAKDLRFGVGGVGEGSSSVSRWKASAGMGAMHVSIPDRRDRR